MHLMNRKILAATSYGYYTTEPWRPLVLMLEQRSSDRYNQTLEAVLKAS